MTSNEVLSRIWQKDDEEVYTLREDLLEEEIRSNAYHLWENNGKPEGKDLDFWLTSERQVHELVGL